MARAQIPNNIARITAIVTQSMMASVRMRLALSIGRESGFVQFYED